jgi:hypothetical protein
MAVKQNGVLATFTPTVSDYTNNTVDPASNAIATNGWCMYTVPTATLTSAKLIVSNDTGSAANIDVGIVEQTDVIQFDALNQQPGTPSNYGAFAFPSGTATSYASSIVVEYGNLSVGANITPGLQVTWTNTGLSAAFQSCTATVHYHDTANAKMWLRNMSHPEALQLTTNTTFTTSGGTFEIGSSIAGSTGNAGWSGWVRFYDSLQGTLYLNNWEFRNNLDYQYLYANDANENRQQNNNNLARSHGRIWRPVATTTPTFDNAGNTNPLATEFIDAAGVEVKVSGVSQIAAEQYLVKQKQVADNDIFELSGLVLGDHQSIFVSSTAAVSFSLIGFEEIAETLS